MRDLALLTADDFVAVQGATFEVAGHAEAIRLSLSRVDLLGSTRRGRQAFSLLFRGPASAPLPQQTHRLTNATLGALDIFLVPLAPDGDGCVYEAVFT